MFVDLIDANSLKNVDADEHSINHVAQGRGENAEIGGTQFPGEDSERGIHGNIHKQIEKEIPLAGYFHGAGFFWFKIG